MFPLSLSRPDRAAVHTKLLVDSSSPFTYDPVGATQCGSMGQSWFTHQQDAVIGSGEADFAAAVEAVRRWEPFDLDWIWPINSDVPIEPGGCFGFLAWTFGVWSINMCRIVYVIDDEDEQTARFGFAYGTLAAHSLQGEERFLVTWDKATDEVRFDIKKFSRPASSVLRIVDPITRWIQGRFTREALVRISRAVAEA